MIAFLIRRLVGLGATLLVAALVTFVVLDWLPGDPARYILGMGASEESIAAMRGRLMLDRPPIERLSIWFLGVMRGDFGVSATLGEPAALLIIERLGVTLPLAVLAIAITLALGLPIGVLAARQRGSFVDTGLMAAAQLGVAVPSFWFGMLLVQLFAANWRILPSGGFVPWSTSLVGALASLLLPAVALALPQAAILARVMRTALIEVAESDFIRTARAKGLTRDQALWRHGVRNAIVPVLTIMGLQFAYLIAGAVIVENIFYLPGLGRFVLEAVEARDLVLVRASVMVLVLMVTVIMLFADLAHAWADPRLAQRTRP